MAWTTDYEQNRLTVQNKQHGTNKQWWKKPSQSYKGFGIEERSCCLKS